MERGRKFFIHLEKQQKSDDVAVGIVVHKRLNATQTVHEKFHSHYESNLRDTLAVEEIAKQVTFGYDNKNRIPGNETNDCLLDGSFPNVPFLFPIEEDPLRFLSLRCFLLKKKHHQQQQQEGSMKRKVHIPSKCLKTMLNRA